MSNVYSLMMIFVLLFNSTFAVFASSLTIEKANQYKTEDATLICTGSQLRWISLSAFYQTGKMVFIDAPNDAPEQLEQVSCVYSYLSDSYTDTLFTYKAISSIAAYRSYVVSLHQRPYTLFPYQTSHSRAPPAV